MVEDGESKGKVRKEEKGLVGSEEKVVWLGKEKGEVGDEIVKEEEMKKVNEE